MHGKKGRRSMPNPVVQRVNIGESGSFAFKRRVLKPILRGLMRILPPRAFDKFYDFAFPIYKFVVRQAYLLLAILRLDFLNDYRWRRATRVHAASRFSLVGIGGLEASFDETQRLNREKIPGDFVELGVARGGAAALLSLGAFDKEAPEKRHVWLFDSYEGLPEPGANDTAEDNTTGDHVRPLPKGSCLGTLEDVHNTLFGAFNLPKDRISFIKGWFENTVPVEAPRLGKIALLRIDGDWYESTKVCLENLYDRVSPGGSVVIDDYLSCVGCKRAVDEFVINRNLQIELKGDGRGGCFFVKPR
jgi:hypothetical protein